MPVFMAGRLHMLHLDAGAARALLLPCSVGAKQDAGLLQRQRQRCGWLAAYSSFYNNLSCSHAPCC